jgi:phage terminase large subunit-like protein
VWLDKSRFRVLVAGRRFGKTTLAVNELFMNAMKSPCSLNYYIAPTYRQAKQIAWKMLKTIVPEEIISKANESELIIEFVNSSTIELKGCDNPDSLRGVGVSFVVVDEYAVVSNAENLWAEVLRPMLIDTGGRALFIGTPKGLNHFYSLFQKGEAEQDGFKSYRFTSYDNPYIDRKEIDLMKDELPERIFQQEVMTSFLVSSQNVLIKIEDLEALKGNNFYEDHKINHVSCDPAVMGGDECILYAFENTKIIEEKSLAIDDTQKIAFEIVALINKYKATGVSIDSVGVGKGVADGVGSLLRGTDVKVLHISSGEKSSTTNLVNKRTEMWWYLWQLIKDKKVEYIEDLELKRQLSNVEYKIVSESKVALVPKKDTKAMLGRSPDKADAFVYGIWGLRHFHPRLPAAYQQRQSKWFGTKRSPYGWEIGAGHGIQ